MEPRIEPMEPGLERRRLGRWDTARAPFDHPAFLEWAARAGLPGKPFVEPFAGSGNLVRALQERGLAGEWAGFDVEPRGVGIVRQDTLADFPKGFDITVSNPPWLARNSAARRNLPYAGGTSADLYLRALEKALEACGHVAFLVPESFVSSGLLRDRLAAVVSLPDGAFDDTAHPTALALFHPETGAEAALWVGDAKVGRLSDLEAKRPSASKDSPWTFNDPKGSVGLLALDPSAGAAGAAAIRFVPGEEIPAWAVKSTSRSRTRISSKKGEWAGEGLRALLAAANARLAALRAETHDCVLMPFGGTRGDGRWRRRLDWTTARALLDAAAEDAAAEGGQR